ncbi:BglG family transcription antiterminator [Clostridium sp. B9]|uniref:BglG family transcription antiterminator n=1 Tax=Clostridium sp. B9 TaxID=3423224 RepID=UPI003D2EBBDF
MSKRTEKIYEVNKAFNNNIVLVNDDDKEVILFSKGIGFKYKKESIIPIGTEVEKIFTIQDESNIVNFRRLIGNNDKEFIAFCEELILEVATAFNSELNENIHIGLIDHISFAIKRMKNGEILRNPFLVEIETLYPKEFELATVMVRKLEKFTGIDIVDDEIGFIAMHIHSARTTGKVSNTIKYTYIANTAVEYIEDMLDIEVDRASLSYARFVGHLRFAIERLLNNTPIKNDLLYIIKIKYKKSYKVAIEIAKAINEDFGLDVTEDEIGYLALHVERIRKEE